MKKPHKDLVYMIFAVFCGFYALLFLQIFQVLPLYYAGPGKLSEAGIGLLLAFNGLFVFVVEMVLVYSIENRFRLYRIIVTGFLMLSASFLVLLAGPQLPILYAGMLLLSLSEILAMPFMVTLIMKRAGEHARGSYIGIYTMSWSLAFIISPSLTTYIIEHFSYDALWYFNGTLAVIAAVGIGVLAGKMEGRSEE